jgi:hypothetical protein
LQPIAFQRQATPQPLQIKSCLKHYRRFFVSSRMCHHHRVNVEMTGRNEGCAGWTGMRCPPALRAKRFGARNGSSAFGHSAGKRRWRARTPKPVGPSGPHQTRSNLIKPNKSENRLPTRFYRAGRPPKPAILASSSSRLDLACRAEASQRREP